MRKNSSALSNLMVDIVTNKTAVFAKDKAVFAEQAVKEKLVEILGTEKLTYNAWEEHRRKVFTIISEVLNITAPNAMRTNPFFMEMAELKNGADGDQNEFVVKDMSHLVVSKFSGNHWNTDRQKLIGNRAFSVPAEWFSIRVYEEIDRILKGVTTVAEMFGKIQEGLTLDVNDRVYTSFGSANIYLPEDFKESGAFVKDSMLKLIDNVQTATGSNVKIIGTRQGLSAMDAGLGSEWVSESMKNERNTNGVTRFWEGVRTVMLPQSFIKGTYEQAINPKILRVIPDGFTPIKVWYEGENRIRQLTSDDSLDQTEDIETQVKMGIGVVMPDLFAEYTIA